MTANSEIVVRQNEAASRFEAEIEGRLAVVEYERRGDRMMITHTEVPEALEGHGIASKLARVALEYAQDKQLQVVPLCPFVAAYIRRHPEYEALVQQGARGEAPDTGM